MVPLPVTEQSLIKFVAYAVNQGLKLLGVTYQQSDTCKLFSGGEIQGFEVCSCWSSLCGVLKRSNQVSCLPITPSILGQLHRVWNTQPLERDNLMLWAACCFVFWGVLKIRRTDST